MRLPKKKHEALAKKLALLQEQLMEAHMEVLQAYGRPLPYGRSIDHALDGIITMRNMMGIQAGKEHDNLDWGAAVYGEAARPVQGD